MKTNVGYQTLWGVLRDTPGPRYWVLLAVSLAVHLGLFTPLLGLLGLLGSWASSTEVPPEDLNAITAIPVSLLEEDELGPPPAPPSEPAPSPSEPRVSELAPPKPVPPKPVEKNEKKPEARKAEADAGAPEPEAAEAAKPDAGPSTASGRSSAPDAGPPAPPVVAEPRARPEIEDPAAALGDAARLTDTEANVKLLILTDRIREHQLGKRIGTLLGALPQWDSFFAGSSIDAIRDLDRIYLAGPQFRRSEAVMALLAYNVPEARVRAAIDGLVRRSPGGKWLENRFPLAIARADRADRLFALPRAKLAVVAPLAARESLVRDGPKIPPLEVKGEEAVNAFIRTPWRVFLGTPFTLPRSIEWARLKATPLPGGAVTVELIAKDASEAAAAESARTVSRTINDATQLGGFAALLSGFGVMPLLDPVELVARGDRIYGEIKITGSQLARLLGYVETWSQMQRPAQPTSSAIPAGTAPSPSRTPKPPLATDRGAGSKPKSSPGAAGAPATR